MLGWINRYFGFFISDKIVATSGYVRVLGENKRKYAAWVGVAMLLGELLRIE